jgi:hypothetical protein
MNIPVATADTRHTPTDRHTVGAIHTTADMVGGTDGIMMDGVMMDGVMKDMVTADTLSPIQDTARDTIAADPSGRRVSRTVV